MTEVMTDEFIKNTVALANGYALWFAGVPDAEMMPFLDMARANMTTDLAQKFGAEPEPSLPPATTLRSIGPHRPGWRPAKSRVRPSASSPRTKLLRRSLIRDKPARRDWEEKHRHEPRGCLSAS
jgi:hypothetical protein